MTYELQLDFEESIQTFTDLKPLFIELKRTGHIFIYNPSDDKYKEAAADHCIDATKASLYIETTVSAEGVFVEGEAFWIENYLLDEFSNPEKRPYIEKYL